MEAEAITDIEVPVVEVKEKLASVEEPIQVASAKCSIIFMFSMISVA